MRQDGGSGVRIRRPWRRRTSIRSITTRSAGTRAATWCAGLTISTDIWCA